MVVVVLVYVLGWVGVNGSIIDIVYVCCIIHTELAQSFKVRVMCVWCSR